MPSPNRDASWYWYGGTALYHIPFSGTGESTYVLANVLGELLTAGDEDEDEKEDEKEGEEEVIIGADSHVLSSRSCIP